MHRRTASIAAILLASAVLAACGDKGGPSEPVLPGDYQGLSTDNLPASRLLDVPLRSAYGAFCYVQSRSMMLADLDASSTEAEAFTYAGFGATLSYNPYSAGFVPAVENQTTDFAHHTVLESYGARFVIGSGGGYGGFVDQAAGKIAFRSADEALKYLKAAIASGRPVQVHLDMGYLPSHCRALNEHLDDCDRLAPGASHYVVATGYDATSVYINDAVWPDGYGHPTDPRDPRFKNMKIPATEFMQAWQKTQDIGPYGPYWMLFIEQTSGSQLGKKSVSQILALQKELSRDVVADIDRYAGSSISGTQWDAIGKIKMLFGDYLAAHGYSEAGAIYHSLAADYDGAEGKPVAEARALLTGSIRARESEARSKY